MHLYLDHAWMLELGEGLPAYRPPVDHRLMLAGAQPIAADGVPEVTLRYLTPHSKWSIHSEYQDNLHMLTLFRGGSGLWMSPQDAEAIDVRDNDWVEAHNRNGIVVTRVVVSHRVPQGVCLMYHSKDRQIGTPRSVIDGRRGGTENALDHDRDEADAHDRRLRPALVGAELLRPDRVQPRLDHDRAQAQPGGRVLMRVKAQVAMVMNLDKCIGCHTCSVTCKQVWTNRPGTEYVWFNNVETSPGQGYPAPVGRPGALERRLGARPQGPAAAQGGRAGQEAADDLLQPRPAGDRRLLRAVHLRLRDARRRAARRPRPGRAPALAADRQADGRQVGARTGTRAGRRPELAPERPAPAGHQEQVRLTYEQAFMFFLPRSASTA
jgi:hypothetical protein